MKSESSCCCNHVTVAVTLITTLACGALAGIKYVELLSLDDDENSSLIAGTQLVTIILAASGLLSAAYIIPVCRRRLPAGYELSISAALAGVGLAFNAAEVWNASGVSGNGIKVGRLLRRKGLNLLAPKLHDESFASPLNSVESTQAGDIAALYEAYITPLLCEDKGRLILYAAPITFCASIFYELSRSKFRRRYRDPCTALSLLIYYSVAYVSVVYHSFAAAFALLPLRYNYASIANRVLERPPRLAHFPFSWRSFEAEIYLILLLGGGLGTVLTLMRRPRLDHPSRFRSALLCAVIIGDAVAAATAVLEVPILKRYVTFRRYPLAWHSLLVSAAVLIMVALLHAGVALPPENGTDGKSRRTAPLHLERQSSRARCHSPPITTQQQYPSPPMAPYYHHSPQALYPSNQPPPVLPVCYIHPRYHNRAPPVVAAYPPSLMYVAPGTENG